MRQKKLIQWCRIFQIVVSGGGEANSPQWGAENRKFYWAGVVIFLLGEENLRRSDFDNLNLSQSYKQVSVNT